MSQSTSLVANVWACLVHPSDPRNAGASIRAVANHGLAGMKIVRESPFLPEDLSAFSSGASDVVPVESKLNLDDAIEEAALVVGTSRRERSALNPEWWSLRELQARVLGVGPVVILFGNERAGLSKKELARCQAIVSIPTHERFPSLNLSHAVACVAYELNRVERPLKNTPPLQEPLRVSPKASEALYQKLEKIAAEVTYPPGRTPRSFVARLRQLIRRANPSQAELGLIAGIFKELQRLHRHQQDQGADQERP
ncbi:MAG: TrmH family RNA methyltransferase [Myxococcota bacterium]|nr:TrmH family RNA methyltransferase [Myxococcota bacterium]